MPIEKSVNGLQERRLPTTIASGDDNGREWRACVIAEIEVEIAKNLMISKSQSFYEQS